MISQPLSKARLCLIKNAELYQESRTRRRGEQGQQISNTFSVNPDHLGEVDRRLVPALERLFNGMIAQKTAAVVSYCEKGKKYHILGNDIKFRAESLYFQEVHGANHLVLGKLLVHSKDQLLLRLHDVEAICLKVIRSGGVEGETISLSIKGRDDTHRVYKLEGRLYGTPQARL